MTSRLRAIHWRYVLNATAITLSQFLWVWFGFLAFALLVPDLPPQLAADPYLIEQASRVAYTFVPQGAHYLVPIILVCLYIGEKAAKLGDALLDKDGREEAKAENPFLIILWTVIIFGSIGYLVFNMPDVGRAG